VNRQPFVDTTSRHQTIDADYERIDTWNLTVNHRVGRLEERHRWLALCAVIMEEGIRVTVGPTPDKAKIQREARFNMKSLWPSFEEPNPSTPDRLRLKPRACCHRPKFFGNFIAASIARTPCQSETLEFPNKRSNTRLQVAAGRKWL
jgi:hypothetical protein